MFVSSLFSQKNGWEMTNIGFPPLTKQHLYLVISLWRRFKALPYVQILWKGSNGGWECALKGLPRPSVLWVCVSVHDILASLGASGRRFTEVKMHFLVTKYKNPLPCQFWCVSKAMTGCVNACLCVSEGLCVCLFSSSVWYILNPHYTFIALCAFSP